MNVYGQLEDLLGRIFGHTLSVQQAYVAESEFKNISVNDMHIIAAIGMRTSRNMSSIAKKMGVTVGTLTIAINSLVKKGYVHRVRSEKDRRVVLISLSEKGERAYIYQQGFHEMLRKLLQHEISQDQCETLVGALTKVEQKMMKKSSGADVDS